MKHVGQNNIISLLLFLFMLIFSQQVSAQLYVEKQSRHRFAQMTLGVDYHISSGGQTSFLNLVGQEQKLDLRSLSGPRFMIGGTHFWGHADFYISIPLTNRKYVDENQEIVFSSGIETVFKYHPWRIKHKRFSPYVGTAFADFYFFQNNLNEEYGRGPELSKTSIPVLAGFTYNYNNHLFEAGVSYNFRKNYDYYLSEDYKTELQAPVTFFNLSYRYMMDTTVGAEKDWESGRTKEITDKLDELGRLDNFFVGVGISTATWLGASTYNESERPYITKFNASLMADFTLGYYLHNADINIAANYRAYKSATRTYKLEQGLRRRSIGLEATKIFMDYHGFAPFIGPIVSYDQLSFIENYAGENVHDISESKLAMGITFGWDIRPTRIQTWVLRTNLRVYPKLDLEVSDGKMVSFRNLEFNFIQLVVYPGRM